jgi:predicted Fe-S protein YdhL (DUF1289 family)
MRSKKFDPRDFERLLATVDLQTDSGPVPSPCINICRVDPKTKLCIGCFRTVEEITHWGVASESDKRAIWREIQRRHATGRKARRF